MSQEETPESRLIVRDFLIPALDAGTFGDKLFWSNKEEGYFKVYWSHKNAANWLEEDTVVFQEWDKIKGNYNPHVKGYYMSCKHRFRSALYKHTTTAYVQSVKCGDGLYRCWKICPGEKKKPCKNLAKSRRKVIKRTTIPTSVIKRYASLFAKSATGNKKEITPSPPRQYADEKLVIAKYKYYARRQREKLAKERLEKLERVNFHYGSQKFEESSQTSRREVPAASDIRENSSTPRISHISPRPVPEDSFEHLYIRSYNVQVCPPVFLSRIYNEPENMPQAKDGPQSCGYANDDLELVSEVR